MTRLHRNGWLAGAVMCAATAWASAWASEPARIGSDACASCHDEVARGFRATVHARAARDGSCESCHGAGGAHAEGGDAGLIRRFGPSIPAAVRTAGCLACHVRDPHGRTWAGSDHAIASLACDDCHDPHRPAGRTPLLRTAEPELCYGCHATVRAQFQLTERHPLENGSIRCSDCHDPHAPSDRGRLAGFKQGACLDCHTEYRGPWVFEHESVAVEGCTACHAPHGSTNRHLLTYQRVGDLCLQCHPGQPFFHVVVDGNGRRTTGFNDCTRCHTEIHGSNNDALFLN